MRSRTRPGRWPVLGGMLLALTSAPVALADEIAEAAAEAEALLATGDAGDIWAAFERATALFWAEAPLGFRVALLAEDVRGFGQYVPRQELTYAAGDEVTAYVEPVGYGWTAIGDEFRIRFVLDIEIANEAGETVAADDAFAEIERLARTRTREFQATVTMTLPLLQPGRYVLRLTFNDSSTGKAGTAELAFTVAP